MSLSPIERLTATAACTALMHEYGYRFDHGDGVSVAELFTEDGEWISPAIACHGRAKLEAFFSRRDAMTERFTRHVVTNILIDVQSLERASARSIAIEYRGTRGADGMTTETAPALVGDYEDEFVQVGGTWRFHRRTVVIEFKRSGEQFLRPEPS